jgi:hypothetical protein
MTTTREQLELAAKAYWGEDFEDVSARWSEEDDGLLYICADNQDHNGLDCEFVWAPHRDQSDSDQMACALEIALFFSNGSVTAYSASVSGVKSIRHDNTDEGKCAAVREARMLVAVEIGRNVK